MSSDKIYGTIADQQGDPDLTTSYGGESAGWTTKGIDVSQFDAVTFEIVYHHQDTAALLSLKPLACDRNAEDLDDYVEILQDSGGGTLAVTELTLDVSGLTDDTDNSYTLPPMDVRGISMLRMAAKIDDASDNPELVMRYIGHRQGEQRAQLSSPNVT